MARRGRRAPTRRARYAGAIRRRAPGKMSMKKHAMSAAKGVGLGLAVAIPLGLAAKYFNMPDLMEVGQRGGAVAASAVGGTAGQLGFQAADAIFDRFLRVNGMGVSGSQGFAGV